MPFKKKQRKDKDTLSPKDLRNCNSQQSFETYDPHINDT